MNLSQERIVDYARFEINDFPFSTIICNGVTELLKKKPL